MTPEQHDRPETRAIDLDVEVPGTPEQVWEAVASGPGITAWFVPARVDGRAGGTVELDFGPGYGVETARITAWEPPRRFVTETAAGEGRPAFAMEWLVEARDGATCLVRLIHSGFGSGDDWDAEYDATDAGWRLFLYNLRLYLTHFPGQRCSSVLVNGRADGPVDRAFGDLAAALGLPAEAGEGERVAAAPGVPPLAGTVERSAPNMLTVLLERPAPGIAFVVAEPAGAGSALASVYAYLFGEGAAEAAARDEPAWRAWMQRHFPMAEAPAGA
jgi:uncharacterized protein YndB with AHSA1/START domain